MLMQVKYVTVLVQASFLLCHFNLGGCIKSDSFGATRKEFGKNGAASSAFSPVYFWLIVGKIIEKWRKACEKN